MTLWQGLERNASKAWKVIQTALTRKFIQHPYFFTSVKPSLLYYLGEIILYQYLLILQFRREKDFLD